MIEKLQPILDKVSPRYWLALYLTILFAVGAVVLSIILYPQELRATELSVQLEQENMRLKVVENFVLAHPNGEQYLAEIDQAQAKVDSMLPKNTDLGRFMLQIEKDARETGVQLVNVKPAPIVARSTYREMPFEIWVRGRYFQVMAFLKKLEDGDRFTVPTGVAMQSKQNSIDAKVNVTVFSFGVPPVPANPPKAP